MATASVHLQVGTPTDVEPCSHCHGCRYTFPLTALLPTGVQEVGSVKACPRCDTAERVCAQWRADRA
jgi:hypothetical protein